MGNAAPLCVLGSPKPTADETSLQSLAQFLGLQICTHPENETAHEVAVHMAATCQSLNAFQRLPLTRAWLSSKLAIKGSSLFLTGITPSAECLQTIEDLLPGVVESVMPLARQDSAYEIASIRSTGMPQLAGLTFGPIDREVDSVFALKPNVPGVTVLVSIAGQPCYIKVDRGRASYFLLACARVLDIDAPAERGREPIDCFLRLVPFLAYLRLTFGAQCWTNEEPAACFIIDDPLLRERYGFLDFTRLESQLASSRFSMNIAFIPWNYRRTDPRVAERFKRPDRRFSISVHGCDHTEAEFGVTDERWLRYQSRLALSRMQVHEGLTGIKHNRVMVFPQGVFSKASLRALGDEGFLAAVNSTVHPVDATPDEITFRDLLEVAVVRFGGAPLFLRHYPDKLEAVALDLFLGRQVLIVEHHRFFKRGYEKVKRCTAFVNTVAPAITWTDLENVCASACLIREVPGDGMHVRAFGPVLRLRNHRGEKMHFRVSNVGVPRAIESILWKGRAIDVQGHTSGALCDVVLDPGEEGVLSFLRTPNDAHIGELASTAKDRFKVFTRRLLCEVRDNYLDRSTILSELTKLGKGLLPRL